MKTQQQNAALYLRLSRDDGGDAESNSISNQRLLLQNYARERGFVHYFEYVDDGVSGTTFERSGLKQMISDIEAGKIHAVICKDMSRFGRNNAMVAFYTEIFFPENDIQFIAVNDNIDTFHGENEIMGFKSILNEYYARDISKKIRSSKKIMAAKGEFVGTLAPYGYQKHPDDCHRFIVDEETAPIVKMIFEMAAKGITTQQIKNHLTNAEILTPLAYIAGRTGKYQTDSVKNFPTLWNAQTVISILKNKAYCGHMVQQMYTSKSFKNKKIQKRPESEWVEARNTHQHIVDEQTYEIVQSFLVTKKRKNSLNEDNIFSGLLKCSTCDHSLTYNTSGRTPSRNYMCNHYRRSTKRCTSHYITLNRLYQSVLHDIRSKAAIAKEHENSIEEFCQKISDKCAEQGMATHKRDFDKCRKRSDELDAIIKGLFEQRVTGGLTQERFLILSREYETEQAELKRKIETLTAQINKHKNDVSGAIKFFDIIRKFTDISELTKPLLHELIEKIVVYDGEGSGNSRKQKVEIYYRFVGLLPD
jgi:DNA invertase Pin-like site-specific DNA recombinase